VGVTGTVLAYGMGYAVAGWAVCGVAGLGYAVSLIVRGKRAAARVPDGHRRWSDPG
jgi:hypothetical protein